jgi:DNA-binding HxlR family transcriptional regulator
VESIEQRVSEIERRLSTLEQRAAPEAPPAAAGGAAGPLSPWVANVLAERQGQPFSGDPASGSVLYAGAFESSATGPLRWQIERPVPGVLSFDWSAIAGVFDALGQPVRLLIVRELLRGARTTQDLQQLPGIGTTGQVYHHLRELQASGIVVNAGRNDYRIRPERVVACLVMVAAAAEFSAPPARGDELAGPFPD